MSSVTERSIRFAGLTQNRRKQAVSEVEFHKAMVYLSLALRPCFTKAAVLTSKFSISHTELTISRSRDYKRNTVSFENTVSKFARHRFDKGRNMHTDKQIDGNYGRPNS